jgi:hypothetical protein
MWRVSQEIKLKVTSGKLSEPVVEDQIWYKPVEAWKEPCKWLSEKWPLYTKRLRASSSKEKVPK